VIPCDVPDSTTPGKCANNPTSVHGFLLEVDPFNFPGGFLPTQHIPKLDYGPDGDVQGVGTDMAALVTGYIFGGRNQDAFLLASGDDVFRVMVDFNRDGSFTANEWGSEPQGANNGVTYSLTSGHFGQPGCYQLKGGYYNGPTNRQFHLAAVGSATPDINTLAIQNAPRLGPENFFLQPADCPVCACAAGSFISADCTATTNAVCTPCCNSNHCDGTTLSDPDATAGGCPNNWDCPAPATNEWEWRYDAPTCESLSVVYPASLPAGQANDVNVRIQLPDNSFLTLNFHLNGADWSGTQSFHLQQHPDWPTNIDHYSVVWVQVAGTNCHWTGSVDCCQYPTPGGVMITPAPCGVPPMAPTTTPPANPWEWTYPPPTCTGVTVDYPTWLPSGQANDANVRVWTQEHGELTFNFHCNNCEWSGTHVFDFIHRADWPSDVTAWIVEWVQVGGTNYHWNGQLHCP